RYWNDRDVEIGPALGHRRTVGSAAGGARRRRRIAFLAIAGARRSDRAAGRGADRVAADAPRNLFQPIRPRSRPRAHPPRRATGSGAARRRYNRGNVLDANGRRLGGRPATARRVPDGLARPTRLDPRRSRPRAAGATIHARRLACWTALRKRAAGAPADANYCMTQTRNAKKPRRPGRRDGAEEMTMDEPTIEFASAAESAVSSVENACAEVVIAFAKYVSKNWKMTEEEWRRNFSDAPPTGTYWDGYNAAMGGIPNAALFFTGRRD